VYFAVELGGTPPLLHAGDPKIVRWEPLRLLAHVQCLGKSPPDTLIVAPLHGTVFNGRFARVADSHFIRGPHRRANDSRGLQRILIDAEARGLHCWEPRRFARALGNERSRFASGSRYWWASRQLGSLLPAIVATIPVFSSTPRRRFYPVGEVEVAICVDGHAKEGCRIRLPWQVRRLA